MATTKQAERVNIETLLADEYLSDLVYSALLDRAEPSKVSEITLEINNSRVTFPAVRRLVADSSRFLTIDRMWDLSARYLDQSRPTERTLIEILKAAGKPLAAAEMAQELSIVYGRGLQAYIQLLAKVLLNKATYFKTTDNLYGLTAWLPLVDAEEEEDILFDNNLTVASLAPYRAAAAEAVWTAPSYADTTYAVAEVLKDRALPHRVAGFLAWTTLRGKYDPLKHLQACLNDDRLVWLSGPEGGRWITRAHADRLEAEIEERAASLGGDETEEVAPPPVIAPPKPAPVKPVEAAPAAAETPAEAITAPPVAAVPPEPEAKPLDINDADLKALEQILTERAAPVDIAELLALRYEVVAGDPSFRVDVHTLDERLKSDDRFLYVGANRFREANSLPLFVYAIPEFLQYPDLQFVSMDGEIMDEEIADEGLIGSLRQDLMDPLAQDAGDDEGRYTGSEPADSAVARMVVKAHHKEIGTFPLCQVPDGFFPSDAPVVEIVVRAPDGATHDIIVNNEIRLAFNLFGLYELLPADSGSVFLLHKAARPFEYRFELVPENDPQIFVEPERMTELLGLREAADEGGDMATFDIACEILASHAKGLTFVQALTEVNIVRRVTRRKLASILSNYYCFMQKAGTDQWRFDPRKRDLGTDRAKRKYIKR